MAKRFTDTEKYKKQFIRNLPASYKLFWDYLYHDCNLAGIWYVDFDVAQIRIGKDAPINYDEALHHFNNGEERVFILDEGKKWFIKSFIDFQYGELTETNKLHIGVIRELKKEGVSIPLRYPYVGAKCKYKDKYKNKDKDKDNNKNKIKFLDFIYLKENEYNKLIEKFGKSKADDLILELNDAIGSKGYRYRSHYYTILNWKRRNENVKSGNKQNFGEAKPIPGKYSKIES